MMADRHVWFAVGGATAIGALALPIWQVGIGWPLAALALAGTALVARRHRSTSGEPATGPAAEDGGGAAPVPGADTFDRAWRIGAGVAALLLAAVPAIRAAGWLAALCLAAATLLGSYALAGGRSWAGALAGGLAFLPAAVGGLGWSATAGTAGARWLGRAVAGLLTGTVLIVIFGLLFSAADPAFRDLLYGWFHALDPAAVVRAALGGVVVALGALAAVHLARTRTRTVSATALDPRLGPLEWAIPLAMLDILFGIFVWLQVPVLFGGDAYVLGPGGPDYAVHAHHGFTQLAIVTGLTLGVVAVLVAVARRRSAQERGLLRLLGGVLCTLTLVIVASACQRLAVYAGAYGLTVPRLLAFAGEVWLGLVIVLLLAAGVRLRATWMPRATAAAGVLVLFTLVAINPDALMARTLLSRLDGPYPVDYLYLSGLSADAAAELAKASEGRCTQASIDDPWYAFNLSRYLVRTEFGSAELFCTPLAPRPTPASGGSGRPSSSLGSRPSAGPGS
jgi:Domain of unknown function (DUF4153)